MLLGKRPRPHIRRTTSMTAFTSNVDMLDSDHHPHNDHQDHEHDEETTVITNNNNNITTSSNNHGYVSHSNNTNYYDDHGRFLASMVLSPRNMQQHQRSSSSGGFVIEPANFLRTCGLCGRRLASGKDIYMYRGDTAFCSQECREKRMEQDERKEKYNEVLMATKREEHHGHSSRNSKTSSKGETLATA